MRINRFVVACIVAASAASAALVGVQAPAQAASTPAHYYLALGDSLSQGYMPTSGNTNQGYVDDLYASLAAKDPSLQLVKLGCSGETTTTMINGGICSYPGAGSQLTAAEQFLAAHKGSVSYVTLDIGANDVDGCAVGGTISYGCVVQGVATVGQNLAKILYGLRSAGGYTGRSIGMNYYDPFLQEYLTGTSGQTVAIASIPLLVTLNTIEALEYSLFGYSVADVFDAFQTANLLGRANVPGYGSEPTDVATICQLTFECNLQNIHANAQGYQVIADAFAAQLH